MNRNRPRLSPECRAAIGSYERRTGTKAMGGSRNKPRQPKDDDEED